MSTVTFDNRIKYWSNRQISNIRKQIDISNIRSRLCGNEVAWHLVSNEESKRLGYLRSDYMYSWFVILKGD